VKKSKFWIISAVAFLLIIFAVRTDGSFPNILIKGIRAGAKTGEPAYGTLVPVESPQNKYISDVPLPVNTGNPNAGRDYSSQNASESPAPSYPSQGISEMPAGRTASPASPPHIDSISPLIATTNPYEVIISGSGFASANNAVLIPSESQYGFGGIPSADGKTLKIEVPFSLADKVKQQLSALPAGVNRDEFITAFVSHLIGTGGNILHQNGVTYIRVPLSVQNVNGESNTAYMDVDFAALLRG